MSSRKLKKRSRRSVRSGSPFGVEPEKLTSGRVEALELHLEYAFERGVNFRDRTIAVGDVEEGLFEHLDAAMTEMEALSRRSITLRLNSYGGSTYEALAIIGRIRRSSCQVIVEVFGKAMSAAFLILASGTGKRRIDRHAWGMHHGASYSLDYGNHSHHKGTVEQFEREEQQWAKWMAKYTSKDEKYWGRMGRTVDKYYSPEELVELGVADEVI